MLLTNLDRTSLDEVEAALRRGESVTARLACGLSRAYRADELAPLLDDARADDAEVQRTLRLHLPPRPTGAKAHRVTCVIPTHRHTPIGLHALRRQDVELEVLVLANGPAEVSGDRVERVDWEGHGATRQRGVELADGDYVLFTVDDALPRGGGVVRTLVEALEEGGYDAVFGRQVPWPSTDDVTRERLRQWTPPGTEHRVVERLDHVFALYRRETLLEHPLSSVAIGEDLHWRQGRRIGYVPTAPVVHAHPRRARALFRRTRDIHREHIAVGEPPRVPDTATLMGALPGAVAEGLLHGPHEVACQVAELLGQWAAAR